MPTDKMQIDDALLIRYFSDETTPEENILVDEWIGQSEENRLIAENIYYIKYAGDTIRSMKTVNVQQDLKKVWKKIRKPAGPGLLIRIQRVAAVLCLFMLPACIYLLLHNDRKQLADVSMDVPEGSISSLILPDSSRVWLNSGSRVTYSRDYGILNRRLRLSGEGFFEVRTNDKLPLEVEAGLVVVRARGTQFNVKAYPDENFISTLLTEGSVEVLHPGQGAVLIPGDMAVFDKTSNNIAIGRVTKTILHTSWKDRRWIIEGTTLGELAPVLQRRYAVKIQFDDDALKTYKFRGEIQNQTIEQIAMALQLTAPMNYTMNKDTLIFTLDTARKKEFDKIVK